MALSRIPSPDLSTVSIGVATLQFLEASGFTQDGLLLLVRAVYTDSADSLATPRYGYWVYDRRSGEFTQNISQQWASAAADTQNQPIVDAKIIGTASNYQVLALASGSGAEASHRFAQFDAAGLQSGDLLSELLGPDIAPRIERFAQSGDGRFLAVQTDDSVLVPEGQTDVDGISDLYLIDRVSKKVTYVSSVGGAEVFESVQLGSLRVSGNRVEIAFVTSGQFSARDLNGAATLEADRLDAYLWSSDFDDAGLSGASKFTLLSIRPGGSAAGGVLLDLPVVGTDAGVYFTSLSSEMVDGDTNGAPDVYRASTLGSTLPLLQRVSLAGTGELATGASLLDVDPTGQAVALLTDSAPASATLGLYQAVMVDVATGEWVVASTTNTGEPADDIVIKGLLSPTSGELAFTSAALNLAGYEPAALGGSLYVSAFNTPPTLVNAIADQSASRGVSFSFTVPQDAFSDLDPGDTLVYVAALEGGLALPSWLSFNAATRTFSGTPTRSDVGTLNISVTASDRAGASVSDAFVLDVQNTYPRSGIVYHWKNHTLLSGVNVSVASASAIQATTADVLDLRAAKFDAATGLLSVEVWANPGTSAANFDFRADMAGASASSFVSALPSAWTVTSEAVNAQSLAVSGISLSPIGPSTQLGTLQLTLPAGATSAEVVFSGVQVGALSGIGQTLSVQARSTSNDGGYSFTTTSANAGVIAGRLPTDSANAVTSADALATLRIAVGLNPNPDPDGAAGPLKALAVSPYQVMAADVNGNGTVTSADALAILRMAVRLGSALPQEWFFVEERRDFWDETANAGQGAFALSRTSAAWDRTILSGPDTESLNLVGVLKGDVNGSWVAPTGSQDLDNLDPNYFQNLAVAIGVPVDQWGI